MANSFVNQNEDTLRPAPSHWRSLLTRFFTLEWATSLFVLMTALLSLYVTARSFWWFVKTGRWDDITGYEYLLGVFVALLLVILLGIDRSPLQRIPQKAFVAGILLAFFISRILWVLLVPSDAVDDFKVLFNLAVTFSAGKPLPGFGSGQDWPIFMYAFAYPLVLGWIFALFGNTLLVAKVFNVVAGTVTILALYQWIRCVTNEKVARASVVLFLLWPTQLIYTSVTAAEHLSLMATAIGLWLFCSAMQKPERRGLKMLFTGALLALAYLARFPLLVVMIACVITLIVARRFTRRLLVEGVFLLAGFLAFNIAFSGILSSVYQIELPDRSMAGNLLVGMNLKSGGGYNNEDALMYISFPNMDKANEWALQKSLERLDKKPKAIIRLFIRKAAYLWRDDEYAVFWGLKKGLPSKTIKPYLPRLYNSVLIYHYIILLFSLIGAVWLVVKNWRQPGINTICLPILGSTMLHSVLELQTRYHYPFEPMLFVLAALGMLALMQKKSLNLQIDHQQPPVELFGHNRMETNNTHDG